MNFSLVLSKLYTMCVIHKIIFQSSIHVALIKTVKSITEFTKALGHLCILSTNRYQLEELFAII